MVGGRPDRFKHLEFAREDHSAERRKKPFNSKPPDRGGRVAFAPLLTAAADKLEADQQQQPAKASGLIPHLIFRIPIAADTPKDKLIDLLHTAGLIVVSLEPDGAVIAFREETDLSDFKAAAAGYAAGPAPGINPKTLQPYKSTKYDVLEFIEPDQMRLLTTTDRIGPSLKEMIGSNGEKIGHDQTYVLDVELWHPGNKLAARKLVEELRVFVRNRGIAGEAFHDFYVGDYLALARLRLKGSGLQQLLEADAVAVVDLPPRAEFHALELRQASAQDFLPIPSPPQTGPRVCILDSGITSNHPLLQSHIGHAQSFLSGDNNPADPNGHGTRVGGLAVFGDIGDAIKKKHFRSEITLLSARVLNAANELAGEDKLVINQLREVLTNFSVPPYSCRVFNMSFARTEPADEVIMGRQTLWAEEIDILARELKVVIVVSAGNISNVLKATKEAAEEILTTYPDYIFQDHARLADPASAAIAITVGALVESENLSTTTGGTANDIRRIIGKTKHPSPITRCGPGLNGAIKPELTHFGGGLILGGFDNHRSIQTDPGTSVTSFSNDPTNSLFSFAVGTSYAAPRVARLASIIQTELKSILNREPSPNSVRAILANSASVPVETANALKNKGGSHAIIKACGYGLPDEIRAVHSSDSDVVLFCEESLKLDYFHIYKIPVPKQFVAAGGIRQISIALAFDPPVRRRRLDYLAVEMDFVLTRGCELDKVAEAFRKLKPNEALDDTALEQKFKIAMKPSSTSRQGYSRKKSTLQKGIFEMKRQPKEDYGEDYLLIVRAERKWAPIEIEAQDYSLAVRLTADCPGLYALVKARARAKVRARARS